MINNLCQFLLALKIKAVSDWNLSVSSREETLSFLCLNQSPFKDRKDQIRLKRLHLILSSLLLFFSLLSSLLVVFPYLLELN
jgi:hypothetical protein